MYVKRAALVVCDSRADMQADLRWSPYAAYALRAQFGSDLKLAFMGPCHHCCATVGAARVARWRRGKRLSWRTNIKIESRLVVPSLNAASRIQVAINLVDRAQKHRYWHDCSSRTGNAVLQCAELGLRTINAMPPLRKWWPRREFSFIEPIESGATTRLST